MFYLFIFSPYLIFLFSTTVDINIYINETIIWDIVPVELYVGLGSKMTDAATLHNILWTYKRRATRYNVI
jgi:hypothetical protein